MIEMSQLTLLILIELMLALVIVVGLLGYFTLRRKHHLRQAAWHLAERVQSDKPARTKRLRQLLSDDFGYSGAELEQAMHNITQAEMQLFQNLINGYLQDDQTHLQQIDVDEENLVRVYQSLKPVVVPPPPPVLSDDHGEELERLHEENQRLSDELRVTMDTMGRMLNEYSSMFSGGSEDKPLSRAPKAAAAGAEESAGEEMESALEAEQHEVEIPDLQASDLPVEALPLDPFAELDNESEAVSSLEEEVSEIIDEVMEIAAEIDQDEQAPPAAETKPADLAESLLDELEQVDIEAPDVLQDLDSRPSDEPAPEPGSLEEEWAKLLEDEAAGKARQDDK